MPAHGHGVYEVEQFLGGDGLRRAVLLAAVFANEDGGEGAVHYPEPVSRGGGAFGAALEEGFHQEVAVFGFGPVILQQVALAGMGFVPGGGGEDDEVAWAGRVSLQGYSRARSAVCWAAFA